MKKRVVAFIGAVVLIVSCLFVTVSAAVEDSTSVSVTLNVGAVDANLSYVTVIFINGPVVVSGKVSSSSASNPGLEFSYTVDNLRVVVSTVGTIYGYAYIADTNTNSFYCFSQQSRTASTFACKVSTDASAFTSVEYLSLVYDLSNVSMFDEQLCSVWGFLHPDASASEEDLEQARQEGYQAGYTEGYQAGLESTEGYEQGYADGAEAGKQEGYTEGVAAGLREAALMYDAQSRKSIFAFCKMEVHYTYDGTSDIFPSVPFDLSSDGIVSMSGQAMDYINATLGNLHLNYDQSKLVIRYVYFLWGSENGTGILWSWPYQTPIFTNVSYLSYSDWHVIYRRYQPGDLDTTTGRVNLKSYEGRSAFVPDDSAYPSDSIYSLSFRFDDTFNDTVLAFRTFTLSTPMTLTGEGYTNGYVAGYADGVAVVAGPLVDEAYDTGYGSGYALGFANGKKEALTISDTGDWKQLILAVVEAPINTFQSLFNFEILGLDMRKAFGSVLALCVLLIIVKKVIL